MNLNDFFISRRLRNAWITFEGLEFYLRKGTRFIKGERKEVVDLANIQQQEKDTGKGYFSTALVCLEAMSLQANYKGIFVENILNAELEKILLNKEYDYVEGNYHHTCMYKEFNASVAQ